MRSKIFSIRPAKFLTTFFYQLSNFRTIRSLDAPSLAASCPGNDIFLFIFAIYLLFFTKTSPLYAPRVNARGRRTVRTLLCTPLPVGVQCRPHHRSPRAVILRLSVEYVNFLTTPLPDVIQPFPAWSSSSQFSFHHSKHHLLHQPVILHPAYVSKQIQFSFHDLLL